MMQTRLVISASTADRAGGRGTPDRRRNDDIVDLVDDVDAVLWECDPVTFAFAYVSKGAERLLGYPVADWYGQVDFWAAHIHPDDRSAAVALCQAATTQGMDHDFEYRMIHADGSVRWVRDLVRVGTDESGRVVRLRGVLFDQTAGRRAQDALRESEERFRAIFDSTAAGIAILSLDGAIVKSNRAAAQLLGYTTQELRGLSVVDLAHPDQRVETLRVIAAMAAGERRFVDYEARYMHRKGHTITLLVSGAVVAEPESGHRYVVAQMHDVSERIVLQQQLHQSRKLEAIGKLAGGVAHDFNNMLQVVGSYADFLTDEMAPNDPRRDDLDEIRKATAASAELTRQLLAFSRQQVIEPRIVELNALVASTRKLLSRVLKEDIEILPALSDAQLNIRIDPTQLEQAIVNLAVNARDAMPTGGRLTIETALVDFDTPQDAMTTDEMRGRFAMIAMTDTGIGMDAETRRRVFEPYFTTKHAGQGTGLGLATVYGIVRQNHGFILVQSEPGHGSSFKLYFPVVSDAVTPTARHGAKLDLRGVETVLLVEDASAVRAAVRQSLERYGYQVLEAASGSEAIALATSHEGPVHLLLTDLVLPGMTGSEVASHLGAIRPAAKVLYMSGYSDDAIVRQGVLADGIEYLAKPFSPAMLAQRVREVLDQGD